CRPFVARRRSEVYEQILNQAPEHPRKLNEHLSEALSNVCLRALHKDRGQRTASANLLLAELQAARKARPLADHLRVPAQQAEQAALGSAEHSRRSIAEIDARVVKNLVSDEKKRKRRQRRRVRGTKHDD